MNIAEEVAIDQMLTRSTVSTNKAATHHVVT